MTNKELFTKNTLYEVYSKSTRDTCFILGDNYPIRYDTLTTDEYDNRHVKSKFVIGNVLYVELFKD